MSKTVYVVTVRGCVVGAYTTKNRAEQVIKSLYPDVDIKEDAADPGNYSNAENGCAVADMWKIYVNSNPINC